MASAPGAFDGFKGNLQSMYTKILIILLDFRIRWVVKFNMVAT